MNLKARVIFDDSKRISQLLAENSVDLVLTGPPYWNEVVYSDDENQLSRIDNYDNFLKEISKVWDGCATVIKDGGVLAMWVHDFIRKANEGYRYIPFHSDILKTIPNDMILRNVYVWDRYLNKGRGEIEGSSLGTRVQYILIFQKKGLSKNEDLIKKSLRKLYWEPVWHKKTSPKLFGSGWLFSVLFNLLNPLSRINGLNEKLTRLKIVSDKYKFRDYPTECPEDISDLLIKLFSSPGDTILDPFVGSGTTLKSALKLGRESIGIEINRNCKDLLQRKLGGMVTF